ncbi:hypothetical protein O9992_11485 [Vibrio lentus]|nr:hypothetical protein [Vibrio lentus]
MNILWRGANFEGLGSAKLASAANLAVSATNERCAYCQHFGLASLEVLMITMNLCMTGEIKSSKG